jgi:hypothetical protein
VSLNPIHEVYSIKHYVIKFVSDLRQVCGFLWVLQFPRHKSSNWNIFESGVKHLTYNGQMMDQKFVYVVYNIKHLWVIMWHIFTSTNNTTTILFPTQLWELLYTYHVIKQCTEKETTSLSNLLLTIKLNYLHDLKIMFQCLLHLNMYM